MRDDLGRVVWFTGLSGAGKTTLARAFCTILRQNGYNAIVLDGDDFRQGLCKDLGFTDQDRAENVRRVSEVSKLMVDAGIVVLSSFISPCLSERERAKNLIGAERFIEVWVSTPLKICEERDVKGLYRRARQGELKHMTGIDNVYEPPIRPDIVINTEACSINQALEPLIAAFEIPYD